MINHTAIDNAHIERLKKEEHMMNQVYDYDHCHTEGDYCHDDPPDVQQRNNLISQMRVRRQQTLNARKKIPLESESELVWQDR